MPDSARLKKLARAYMAAHPGTAYQQALDAISGDDPSRAENFLAGAPRAAAPGQLELAAMLGVTTPRDVRTNYARPDTDLNVPLGVTSDGTVVTINIDTVSQGRGGTGAHGVVSGITGSGATSLAFTIALALRARNSPGRLQVALIDPSHRIDAATADSVADVVLPTAAMAAEWVTEQIAARVNYLRSADARDINDLPDGELPRLLVIAVDEPKDVGDSTPPTSTWTVLQSICRVGRAVGIHLLLLCAYSSPRDLHKVDSNLCYRISLRQQDDALTCALLWVGPDDDLVQSVRTAPQGDAFLQTSYADQPATVQRFTMATGHDTLRKMIQAARSHVRVASGR